MKKIVVCIMITALVSMAGCMVSEDVTERPTEKEVTVTEEKETEEEKTEETTENASEEVTEERQEESIGENKENASSEEVSSEKPSTESFFVKELKQTDNPRIAELLNASGTYSDGFGEEAYHYQIPQFYDDSESAVTLNKRIDEELSEVIEDEAECMASGVSLWVHWVTYDVFEYGNLASIVVAIDYGTDFIDYMAYTYDFEQHKEVTNTELIAMKGMTEESFVTEVCRLQKEAFTELAKNWPNPMTDPEMINRYISNVNEHADVNLPMYLDKEGNLQVYVPYAAIAGSDWYYQLTQF